MNPTEKQKIEAQIKQLAEERFKTYTGMIKSGIATLNQVHSNLYSLYEHAQHIAVNEEYEYALTQLREALDNLSRVELSFQFPPRKSQ